ncbi:MAG: lysylphosphatidylglycerol synthase transmembrane domain-containing protein [Anaerolineaceae bacterium]
MAKKPQKRWNVIIRWVGSILSLAILVYLLNKIGLKETWVTVKQLSAWRIAAVLVLVFVSRLATFARWHTLLQVQDVKVHWKDSLKLTFAGLFASNVLPTTIGGDVFRLAGAVRLGIDSSLAAASLVTDRLVGMTGMLLVLPLAIPSVVIYLQQRDAQSVLPALFSAVFLTSAWEMIKGAVVKVSSNFKYWFKHPMILLQALGFTFVHMLATFLIIKILVEGMGDYIPFNKIAGLWSLTYFISLIPVSINGLGLQEVTITNLFSTLGGLEPSTSISLAVILRAVWMIGSLPGVFMLSGVLSGKETTDKKVEE